MGIATGFGQGGGAEASPIASRDRGKAAGRA